MVFVASMRERWQTRGVESSNIPTLIAAAVDGLPPRPPVDLDAYLDAAETCIRRYGWSRTSPQDIARELGVNRTTVYRVLGPKDAIFRQLVAREVHRLIEQAIRLAVESRARDVPGAETIIELTASAIEAVRANPTIAKLLEDEPELVAEFMRESIPSVIDRFSRALGPVLEIAMEAGIIARRDPHLMTEWMVRMGLSLLFAPPQVDLRAFLAAGVRPLFEIEVST
jgi:AcrR family transcriptional regulator